MSMADNKADLIAQCNHIHAKNIVDNLLLLGISTLAKALASDLEVHDLLQEGLPAKVVRSLLKKTGLSSNELSIAVPITEGTLKRLVAENSQSIRLSSQQSDALWKFAAVFVKAQDLMGSAESAKKWLCSNARSLRYRKPIDVLALSPGADLVMRVLNQLQHGVYI